MTPEEYYASHQKAFRTAFDFLNAHFPPGTGDDWWTRTAEDAALKNADADNRLATELLVGVYMYLGDEAKRRIANGSAEN